MENLAKGKNDRISSAAVRELLIAMQGKYANVQNAHMDVKDIADMLQINIKE